MLWWRWWENRSSHMLYEQYIVPATSGASFQLHHVIYYSIIIYLP